MTSTDPAPLMNLLPANALTGVRVGISVSNSPDLARLGLLEIHFRLALGEIARCVVVSGGMLSYAGRIDPTGYTAFLIKELQRFHRRDRPLLVTLALAEHRALTQQELQECRADVGLFGSIDCLDQNGSVIASTADEGSRVGFEPPDETLSTQALSAMRAYLAQKCDARVLLGGRRTGYTGDMPGLIEEAVQTIHNGKPLYLAGGFGGATFDIVGALGVDDGTWFPTAHGQATSDQGQTNGLTQLIDLAKEANWDVSSNGLTIEENKRLAATHRPSEIAALVSLGLGRKFYQSPSSP
jgi:hypothetical protein